MFQTIRDFFWVVLLPISWVYSAAVQLSFRLKKPHVSKIPTLSVGNLHWGGTGKTPLVIQIAEHFSNKKPAILSRGYRAQLSKKGATVELDSSNGPALFGDEPWMIAKKTFAKVYIGSNRRKVIETFKIETNHKLLILDDGFQHRRLAREIDLVVVPGDESPILSACLPAGNLREPLRGIRRATLVVITCSDQNAPEVLQWKSFLKQLAPQVPVFLAERKSHCQPIQKKVGAFCGVANPLRFKKDLEKTYELQFFKTFRDHQNYKTSDLEALYRSATQQEVETLLTTEKDYPKVERFFREKGFPLSTVSVTYELTAEFWRFLEERIEKAC